MTARTSQKLADALRSAGFEDLAKRAEADEFHDFLSPHALPDLELDRELLAIASGKGKNSEARHRLAAQMIRARHHDGEFDADKAESDEWAASENGKAAMAELARGIRGGKP